MYKNIKIIFWVLLFYITLAICFWTYKLQSQNTQINELKKINLQSQNLTANEYQQRLKQIDYKSTIKTFQFISEGLVIITIIFFIAIYIYKSTHKFWQFTKDQQQVLSALSHDLKTPLSIIKLNVETITKYSLTAEKIKELIYNTQSECFRLETITNNILLANEMTLSSEILNFQPIDLGKIINNSISSFKLHQNFNLITLNFPDENQEIIVLGDKVLLEIAFRNIIDNALKYGLNKEVLIKISVKKNEVNIAIHDQGPGLSQTEKSNLFTRFANYYNDQKPLKYGSGLGLYISHKILNLHKANLIYQKNNAANQGSIFIINYPYST